MIRPVAPSENLFGGLCGHPLLMTMIGGRAACPQPDMDFWALEQQPGEPTAFLCRSGSVLFATGLPCCGAELAEFCRVAGFTRLVTDLALPQPAAQPMVAMVSCGSPVADPLDTRVYSGNRQELSVVEFALLQQHWGGLQATDSTDHYAVALSHMLRHGGAAAILLYRSGQPVAAAALTHRYNKTIELSAVAVNPDFRGQGLAVAVTRAAIGLAGGLNVMLCCHPALERLYAKAGFVPLAPILKYTA